MTPNAQEKALREAVRNATVDGEPNEDLVPWFIAEQVTTDDAALCRNTKPLIETAYSFFRSGIACRVEGRDIGEGLIQLANKWKRISTLSQLADRIEEYKLEEMAKWAAKDNAFKVQTVEDRCETLLVIITHLINNGLNSVSDLVSHIRSLFSDTPEGEKPKAFTLSTIHKAKGREWNRVYILERWLMPSKYAKQPWQLEQESNLEYVAITRAKQELIYVE